MLKEKKTQRELHSVLNSEVHEVIFEGIKWIRMKLEEASATTDFLQNVYNTKIPMDRTHKSFITLPF